MKCRHTSEITVGCVHGLIVLEETRGNVVHVIHTLPYTVTTVVAFTIKGIAFIHEAVAIYVKQHEV